ncbi:MAG: protein kinase domain-containing protein [Lysobacter sp.]
MPHPPNIDVTTAPLPDIRGYQLLRVINHGGMSTVYLAEQIALSREVAIKVMAPQALSDEVSRRRFENEVRTIARLEHPHVVRIHELGRTSDGLPYYAMPYLSRGHLGQRSFQNGSDGPDEAKVIETLRALLSALEYAHGRGVVHRDVKAENVLFDDTERPLLADFGIALRRGFGPRVTAAGLAVGSTAYMAPEQARGEDVNGRADLYSLGVLAWEMLTGRLPYEAADALSMAVMHAQDPIPKLPPHLRHWQRFMNRALAKQPGERFSDVAQMSAMLSLVERRRRWPQAVVWRERIARRLGRVSAPVWAATSLVILAFAATALVVGGEGRDGFFRDDNPPAADMTPPDPITAMLQPLPEAPLQVALDTARRQIDQRNFTAPADDNAFASVLRAWQIDPGSTEVQKMVDQLTGALSGELLVNLRQGKDDRATDYAGHVLQLGVETGTTESEVQHQLRADIGKTLQDRVAKAAAKSDRKQALSIAALAEPMGLPPETTRKLQARAAEVPKGGSASRPDSNDADRGNDSVAMSLKPVSRDEFSRFADATGRKPALCRERASLLRVLSRRDWREPGFGQGGGEPVVCVSLIDAQAYAQWYSEHTGRNYRLPTIAESHQRAPEVSGRELSLWQLECGEGCKERKVDGRSWRSKTTQRVLDASRGYDDVGFRLVRER